MREPDGGYHKSIAFMYMNIILFILFININRDVPTNIHQPIGSY